MRVQTHLLVHNWVESFFEIAFEFFFLWNLNKFNIANTGRCIRNLDLYLENWWIYDFINILDPF